MSTNTEPKRFCVDCKYYAPKSGAQYHACNRAIFTHVDIVTRKESIHGVRNCYDERHSYSKNECASEGRYWQPREAEQLIEDKKEKYPAKDPWWMRMIQRLGT